MTSPSFTVRNSEPIRCSAHEIILWRVIYGDGLRSTLYWKGFRRPNELQIDRAPTVSLRKKLGTWNSSNSHEMRWSWVTDISRLPAVSLPGHERGFSPRQGLWPDRLMSVPR